MNLPVKLGSIALCIAMSGCASRTIYDSSTSTDSKGNTKAVAVKRFQDYGDITGPHTITVAGGTVIVDVRDPSGSVPIMKRAVLNKKGEVVGMEEVPIVASSSNSAATTALFRGIDKSLRGVGSLAGTILAGMVGIESAKALGAVGVAMSNNAAKTGIATTNANAATQQARIAADAAAAVPVP